MEKYIYDKKNGLWYKLIGDYYIPNLILPPEEEHRDIGIWGQRHRNYLKQHNQVTFNIMLLNGTLYSYLADINEQATDMFSRLVDQMAERNGITKKLKIENPMEWVRKMNAIQEVARELVKNDLIYA